MGRVKELLIEQEECQEPEGYNSFRELAIAEGWEDAEAKQQLVESHYYLYKEVHGIKPRWIDYDAMSLDELIADFEALGNERDREIHASNQELEEAINLAISHGAKDREQALEWLKGE